MCEPCSMWRIDCTIVHFFFLSCLGRICKIHTYMNLNKMKLSTTCHTHLFKKMKYKHPPPSTFCYFFPTFSPVSRTTFRFVWEEDKRPTSPKVSRSKVPSEATFSHFILKQQWRRAAWRITLNPWKKTFEFSSTHVGFKSALVFYFPPKPNKQDQKKSVMVSLVRPQWRH